MTKKNIDDLMNVLDSIVKSEIDTKIASIKNDFAGYIYVLVNPSLQSLVKLGYADDLAKRIKTLSGSGLPEPYHCYAAYKVKERLEDKTLHQLIDDLDPDLRYADNREFYKMDKERAVKILTAIAKISGTNDCLIINPLNDEYFSDDLVDDTVEKTNVNQEKVKLNPRVDLLLMPKTQKGTKIYFGSDHRMYGTVVDHGLVDIAGETYPLWYMTACFNYCLNGKFCGRWNDYLALSDGTLVGDLWDEYLNTHTNVKSNMTTASSTNEKWNETCKLPTEKDKAAARMKMAIEIGRKFGLKL